MVDYQNGKIYKLTVDEDTSLVYYGSTIQSLSQRLSEHRSKFRAQVGDKSAYELFKVGAPKITLLENFPCDSIEELKSRERHYIENNECVNKVIPGRTSKEWYTDNQERIKEYRETHKEEISEYMKSWREKNAEHKKEYAKEYYDNNRDQQIAYARQWRNENPEYRQEYYQQNKEKLMEQQRVRREKQHAQIKCDCGGRYTTSNKSAHVKSEKHKKWATLQVAAN